MGYFFTRGWMLAVVFLAGCATLFSGNSHTITVTTSPADANIYFNGKKVGQGTATFSAGRTAGSAAPVVKVERAGYATEELPLQLRFNNVALLNLSSVSSWATDLASGSLFQYDPNTFHVQLKRQGRADLSDDQKMERFVLLNASALRHDLAKGEGEYLDTLVALAYADEAAQSTFRRSLLEGHDALLSAESPLALADAVMKRKMS